MRAALPERQSGAARLRTGVSIPSASPPLELVGA